MTKAFDICRPGCTHTPCNLTMPPMRYLLLLLLFSHFFCNSQTPAPEKIIVDSTGDVSGYYLVVRPPEQQIRGAMILLNGFGSPAEKIFPETRLHEAAARAGILTVGMSMGNKICADSMVEQRLNTLLRDVIQRYGVKPDAFVLGGFSAGGAIALRYTERCQESPGQYPVQPKAVFAIDAPLDLLALWRFFDRQMARNFAPAAVGEARFVSDLMAKEYGTPSENREIYLKLTPFCAELTESGNERHLVTIPVRVYHDVDITWLLKNRRQSAFDANFAAASEMINRLLLAGNDRAEFITGKTGIRSNGVRHPHAWSIVDEDECVQWVSALLP